MISAAAGAGVEAVKTVGETPGEGVVKATSGLAFIPDSACHPNQPTASRSIASAEPKTSAGDFGRKEAIAAIKRRQRLSVAAPIGDSLPSRSSSGAICSLKA